MKIISLIKSVVVYGCFIGAGYYIHKNAVPGEISWKIAGAILTVAWVARVTLSLTSSYRKAQAKMGRPISMKNIGEASTATMPDWLLGYYNTEKKIYRFAWRALRFASRDETEGFLVRVPRANGIRAALLAGIVVSFGVWAAFGLVEWLGTGSSGIITAVVAAGLALYVAIWILGDWRATTEYRHRIYDSTVELNLGVRRSVTIPLGAIARCGAAGNAYPVQPVVPGGTTLDMSLGTSPSVLLELLGTPEFAITRFGYPIPASISVIALTPVDADGFIAAVSRKLHADAFDRGERQPA